MLPKTSGSPPPHVCSEVYLLLRKALATSLHPELPEATYKTELRARHQQHEDIMDFAQFGAIHLAIFVVNVLKSTQEPTDCPVNKPANQSFRV